MLCSEKGLVVCIDSIQKSLNGMSQINSLFAESLQICKKRTPCHYPSFNPSQLSSLPSTTPTPTTHTHSHTHHAIPLFHFDTPTQYHCWRRCQVSMATIEAFVEGGDNETLILIL